jgi:threonine/homoserine/homoserine lactone efflux protein
MLHTTIALVLFLFPLAYSPGPGNLFFAASGARFGFRATVAANAGYHVATWIVTAAIGFGLLAALEGLPQVFPGLKAAGAAHVAWIAWRLAATGTSRGRDVAAPPGFRDGVVLLVLKPKAYLIIGLMFTQFLHGAAAGQAAAIVLVTTVFTLTNLVAFLVWIAMGDRLARAFGTPRSARTMNRTFGAVLAGVAGWMLLS